MAPPYSLKGPAQIKVNLPTLNKNHRFIGIASDTHIAVNAEGHIWVTSGGNIAGVFRSTD